MYPKITQHSLQEVAKKTIQYSSDLSCEYTLTDGLVTAIHFVSKKEGAFYLLLDANSLKELLNDQLYRKNHFDFNRISSLKNEEDLLTFKDFHYLFQVCEGTLKGMDGQYHIYPVSLKASYLSSPSDIASKKEMQNFSSFIVNHPEVEVLVAPEFNKVPYYNQNDDGTLLTFTEGVIKVRGTLKTASLSKSSRKDCSHYFSYSALFTQLYKEFIDTKKD